MFLNSVGSVETSELKLAAKKATPAGSSSFMSGLRGGRHTLEIVNTGSEPVYFGGKGVMDKTGVPIAAGESKIIPVHSGADGLYLYSVAATVVIIAEYTA